MCVCVCVNLPRTTGTGRGRVAPAHFDAGPEYLCVCARAPLRLAPSSVALPPLRVVHAVHSLPAPLPQLLRSLAPARAQLRPLLMPPPRLSLSLSPLYVPVVVSCLSSLLLLVLAVAAAAHLSRLAFVIPHPVCVPTQQLAVCCAAAARRARWAQGARHRCVAQASHQGSLK